VRADLTACGAQGIDAWLLGLLLGLAVSLVPFLFSMRRRRAGLGCAFSALLLAATPALWLVEPISGLVARVWDDDASGDVIGDHAGDRARHRDRLVRARVGIIRGRQAPDTQKPSDGGRAFELNVRAIEVDERELQRDRTDPPSSSARLGAGN